MQSSQCTWTTRIPKPHQDHISFVSSHKGVQLGDQIHQCAASGQAGAGGCHNITLFNSHCVAGSLGAQSPGESGGRVSVLATGPKYSYPLSGSA